MVNVMDEEGMVSLYIARSVPMLGAMFSDLYLVTVLLRGLPSTMLSVGEGLISTYGAAICLLV